MGEGGGRWDKMLLRQGATLEFLLVLIAQGIIVVVA